MTEELRPPGTMDPGPDGGDTEAGAAGEPAPAFLSTVIYRVDMVRSGQPRPYADSTWEAIITLSGDWYGKPPDFGPAVMAAKSRCLVRNWVTEKSDPDRKWHEAYLDELEKLAIGKWRVVIVEPYLD